MNTAATIVNVATIYLAAGGVAAIAFLVIGIDRVEPSARRNYAFRPLLVPGLCLIWPLAIWRWWRLERRQGGPE